MKLVTLPQELSVYQVKNLNQVDLSQQPLFIGLTEEENSIVSPTATVPVETIKREDGWKAFKIEGVLDFSLVGILAEIATVLAEADISLFAVSTFNTDYILIKMEKYEAAVSVLTQAGYTVL
ncbi:ACT domain-containing protein [Enterococcus raffinosus]|uniref:ACT domain-containing protein n=1 Tax=Enterococcus raffinosus TaxID=71452 RepID=A0AAW8TF47_9ENTE|nr:ACT domain-containing protein [Enterococcus raffinosus]MDT2524717.1 ACT domain-containing protein [Enterococcus raffinosus]MDT2528519.1 ACT domain-containing protein [Enterococcus raffinosus]MDT2535434.1 ACT domain-containing protein [Enterococcus raffinosus]MDT2545737.1 ACT domain-containing protein [Enterococcus raffinosus]MDT2553568.1 ACT domain-containing protein [Enterococcus raffinosus]